MAWICYKMSEMLWGVGYVQGDRSVIVFEHPTAADAKADVHYLNGGTEVDIDHLISVLRDVVSVLQQRGQ